jgi:isoquinoline 1-oxidoreductase beta subunit
MPRSEMGQGVHSALAQLVAEELDVPLEHVHLEQASGESLYGNVSMFVAALPLHPRDKHAEPPPLKVRVSQWMVAKIARELGINATGGSSTIADAWHPLRLAAASARAMLVQAAAQRWQLASDTLAVNDGVVSAPGGQRATWGELVSAAVGVKPANVLLKSPETFRLIGKPLPRADIPQVVFAQSTFGLDVRLPDMRFASVRMAPTLGGGLDSLDATDALKFREVTPRQTFISPHTLPGPNNVAFFKQRHLHLLNNWIALEFFRTEPCLSARKSSLPDAEV